MIRNQWYVILESHEVKAGKPVGVTRLGEKLVLWRDHTGKVVCMNDMCPHLGAKMSQGKSNGKTLACPFHGFEYDSSGTCQYVPALGTQGSIPKALRISTYRTYEAHNLIWMYWGEPTIELKPPSFFDTIDEQSFSYMSFQQHWGVHYSRMAENQLDVMHLPFIHHNTIGRGGRMVVDGPLVRLDDDLLRLWVYNRLDDGTPARKMEDLPAPTRHASLEFIFPNLWHNWISDDIHITAAFVPVDDENGIFYGRYYQRVVRIPVLRSLVNLIGVWSSILIANQDHRVVTRQFPKKTELKKMGEKLLQGDRGILTYRTHRHQLKVAAGQIEE